MKVNKKTKIKSISKKSVEKIVNILSDFCVRELGVNKRRKEDLVFYLKKRDKVEKKVFGYYDMDDHEIYIMTGVCKKLNDFIRTFIHEYTHSLQPCKTQYNKLLAKFGYDEHPFELEAYSNEKKYFKLALKEIKDRL